LNSDSAKILRPILEETGIVCKNQIWKPLSGGRSNVVWRIGDKVCKLYKQNRTSELFPNNPVDEQRVLDFLKGTSLAPDLLYFKQLKIGPVLVYKFVDGPVFKVPSEKIAQSLLKLHSIPTQNIVLKRRDSSSKNLLQQCKNLLHGGDLHELNLPNDPNIPDSQIQSIIHGDPVAGNIVDNGKNAVFIDWQCCAIGDPTEDIACALSPAMHHLYGEGELDLITRKNFIKFYDNNEIADRYEVLGHLYHIRIAAYCFWRAGQGDKDYQEAFLKEKDFLNTVYN
jgi:thiamine kinase-like enzyme